jgi:hypothetical protein
MLSKTSQPVEKITLCVMKPSPSTLLCVERLHPISMRGVFVPWPVVVQARR